MLPLTTLLSLTLLIPESSTGEDHVLGESNQNLFAVNYGAMDCMQAWPVLTGTAGAQNGIEDTRVAQPAPRAVIHRGEEMLLLPWLSPGSRNMSMAMKPSSIQRCHVQSRWLL